MRALLLGALLCAATSAAAQSPPYPQIEHGRYLVRVGDCEGCHSAPGSAPMSGGLGIKTPFGTIYSTNLTPAQKTGIGPWTADDLWHVLHEGRSPDGGHTYPAMPYPWMTLTTRTDSDDIFAYLRTLPPVEHQRPANTLIEPLKLGIAMDGWDLLFFKPKTFEPNSDKSAAWNRGAYLVTGLGHCGACHTQVDRFGAAESGKMLQGGTLDTWYAPAIDKAGLADWRIPDIVTYLKTGRNARALAAGPMADVITHSTQFLTDADLSAIATYLKDAPSGAATQASGEGQADGKIRTAGMAIYRDNCAACHGADGNGASNLIPSLHQDGVVLGRDPVGILHVVLHGAVGNATQWAPSDPGMPGFGWKLSDAEVAAVATYIRSAWGNKADPVDSATAHDLRERLH